MSMSELFPARKVKANAWGILTAAALAFALKSVGFADRLGSDIAAGIAFGAFVGVSIAIAEAAQPVTPARTAIARVALIKGVAGSLLFIALLRVFA